MFIELDKQHRYVQYHEDRDTVSPEHVDTVITITSELYDLLQQKMPWTLSSFDVNKTYDVVDIDLFVEIGNTLEDVKANKIKELNELCEKTILGRFTATLNEIEYEFSYDAEAQSRFNGIGLLFFVNKIPEIEWTAYQNGERVRITLNPSDFNTVSLAALQHQNSNIVKFNQLLQQVNNATDKEQVEAIVW